LRDLTTKKQTSKPPVLKVPIKVEPNQFEDNVPATQTDQPKVASQVTTTSDR
jgi:hypothetical protein